MNNAIAAADQAALERAERALASGDIAGAEARLKELVLRPAPCAQACFRLAMIEFKKRNLPAAIDLLQQATSFEPDNAAYRYRLGFAQQHAGLLEEAADNFDKTAGLDPRNVLAMLKAGMLYTQLGEQGKGAELIQRAVLTEPALDDAVRNPKMTPAAKAEIGQALKTLRQQYQTMNQQILDTLSSKYPAGERRRLERAFRMLHGMEEPVFNHPMQRPEFFLMPDMKAVPWFEREEFDWVPRVESAWKDVQNELDELLADDAPFDPYIVEPEEGKGYRQTQAGTDFSSLVGSSSWTAFHLSRAGVIDDNYRRCPATTALMESLPLPEAEDYMPEIFFSRLKPGAHIIPHFGQMNFRLTVHLGLIVPEGCGIRVGDQTRHWEPGKVLAFDDSFEHEAWNRGDKERIVLILEAWHPDIREAEIEGLQLFFRQRAEWLRRCQPLTGNSSPS